MLTYEIRSTVMTASIDWDYDDCSSERENDRSAIDCLLGEYWDGKSDYVIVKIEDGEEMELRRTACAGRAR